MGLALAPCCAQAGCSLGKPSLLSAVQLAACLCHCSIHLLQDRHLRRVLGQLPSLTLALAFCCHASYRLSGW